MTTKITAGEELRQWRLRRDYTQPELARILGVDATVISRWERCVRRPNLDYAVEIENLSGIRVSRWRTPARGKR